MSFGVSAFSAGSATVAGVEQIWQRLGGLAGVAEAVTDARAAVDAALRHRALRRLGGAVAAESSLVGAVASAALSGAAYDVDEVRGGAVADPVVQGALRAARETEALRELWPKAPRQALARLHLLAARDVVPAAELGRPVADPVVAARLDGLAALVVDGCGPPLLVAAVVHGELLALRPFPGPYGLVARAAARLTLVSAGVDVRGLLPLPAGHLARGPEYVGAANAFATGTPDGVRSWLLHCAAATTAAAHRLTAVADAA